MGATIHYRKSSAVDPHLKRVESPSSFIESLKKAFGHFPVELGESHIPILQGMAAMYRGEDDNNPYLEVAELIESFCRIELYASY